MANRKKKNGKRYEGITREEQQRRNESLYREMLWKGYNPKFQPYWNTQYGIQAYQARRGSGWGRIRTTSEMFARSESLPRVLLDGERLVGNGIMAGYADYPDQRPTALTRIRAQQVAAFGLVGG